MNNNNTAGIDNDRLKREENQKNGAILVTKINDYP